MSSFPCNCRHERPPCSTVSCRACARLPCHLRSLAGAFEKRPTIEGVRGSLWRGRTHEICTAEFRHLRVTVLTSGRRRPPCRAVSCRAALGLQHVQLVPCRVMLGHRNATTVPCPCPCAAPCRARFWECGACAVRCRAVPARRAARVPCAWPPECDHCAVPAPCPRATAVPLALVSGRFGERPDHRRGARFDLEGENW